MGIGFKTADTIAAAVGVARDSPERIKAGLAYTLSEAADDGHCYLPVPNLTANAAKILELPAELIAPCLGFADADWERSSDGYAAESAPRSRRSTQLRNNYDKGAAGVFNGTLGVVTEMSAEDHARPPVAVLAAGCPPRSIESCILLHHCR